MNEYKCISCGTSYFTQGNTAPPPPKWDDNHICKLMKVNKDGKQ